METGIFLTIKSGMFGEESKTVALPISGQLMHELRSPVELSNDPTSLLLASPGVINGIGPLEAIGETVTIRKKQFEMRKNHAAEIGRKVAQALLDFYGESDEMNGYRTG
jgi:hypothetical protein